jgi:hypothetical protein
LDDLLASLVALAVHTTTVAAERSGATIEQIVSTAARSSSASRGAAGTHGLREPHTVRWAATRENVVPLIRS